MTNLSDAHGRVTPDRDRKQSVIAAHRLGKRAFYLRMCVSVAVALFSAGCKLDSLTGTTGESDRAGQSYASSIDPPDSAPDGLEQDGLSYPLSIIQAKSGSLRAVEVLPLKETQGTTSSDLAIRLLEPGIQRIDVESTITSAGEAVAPCLSMGVDIIDPSAFDDRGPVPTGSQVAGSGDVVTLPLKHAVKLPEDVYAEQILVFIGSCNHDLPIETEGFRYFEVADDALTPITAAEYSFKTLPPLTIGPDGKPARAGTGVANDATSATKNECTRVSWPK